jgi:hypothetical protein
MKKSELRNIIREVVKDELAYAMRELFKLDEQSPPPKVNRQKKKKTYSNNPILNEILNDTEGGISSTTSEYPSVGGKTYTSGNMGEIVNRKLSMSMGNKLDGDSMVASMGVNPDNVNDSIKDAVSRDYSDLMKVLDKKRKR